jgi:hypothetical protein
MNKTDIMLDQQDRDRQDQQDRDRQDQQDTDRQDQQERRNTVDSILYDYGRDYTGSNKKRRYKNEQD